jgi:hypothetical protein
LGFIEARISQQHTGVIETIKDWWTILCGLHVPKTRKRQRPKQALPLACWRRLEATHFSNDAIGDRNRNNQNE